MIVFACTEKSFAPVFDIDTDKIGFIPCQGDVFKLRAAGNYVVINRVVSGDSEGNLSVSLIVNKIHTNFEKAKQMIVVDNG